MKRKLPEWEPKNVILVLVQKAHFAVRACKLPVFIHRPYMTVRVNLRKLGATFHRGTMFAPMQSIYEKEATGMGTQKCNPCFGAESPLCSTGLQTTGFHASPYRAVSVNLRKLGATFHRGTVFAPMQSIYMKRKLPERRTQKCKPCFGAESPLRSTGLQTTSFHASPYRAVSVNLRKLGATFHCGTVFAPMQSIYMKGSYRKGEPKNVNLVLVQKAHFAVRACKLPVFIRDLLLSQHLMPPT